MTNARALAEQGFQAQAQGRFQDSISFLKRALALDPESAKFFNALGIAYQNTNDLAESEKAYKKAIELKPDYEAAYSNLVSVLERRNKIKDARTVIEKTKALFPGGKFITLNEAIVLKREGNLEGAVNVLKTREYPDDPMTKIKVNHELGLIYDRLEKTDEAFAHFEDFNAFATHAFEINAQRKDVYLRKIENSQKVLTPEWIKSWSAPELPSPDIKLACLMGFVRCGTTLLQHILDSHPDVYASEEVHAFPIVEEKITNSFGDYPESLAGLTAQEIKALRNLYFKIHQKDRGWRKASILVDKYPMLADASGLVYRLFPEAKFIFVKRHPCDVILSAYMQLFVPNEATVHFYNLKDAVNLYCKFMDLWQAYEKVLPLDVFYIRYEDITGDFKNTIGSLLKFLDMPWNDAVLDYDKKVRLSANVISPSYEQVSEKIYQRAAFRWVRYKRYLEPYLEQLKPYAERFGYEI